MELEQGGVLWPRGDLRSSTHWGRRRLVGVFADEVGDGDRYILTGTAQAATVDDPLPAGLGFMRQAGGGEDLHAATHVVGLACTLVLFPHCGHKVCDSDGHFVAPE
jgi:hypothetical protein